MQSSTAAWALRNWAAYSPAVATQALSRASTERSPSNGNTPFFRDSRLAISASASDRLPHNRQTRNKMAWTSPDIFSVSFWMRDRHNKRNVGSREKCRGGSRDPVQLKGEGLMNQPDLTDRR